MPLFVAKTIREMVTEHLESTPKAEYRELAKKFVLVWSKSMLFWH